MKIQKIEINNLASIEGTFVINFEEEPLRSAGLFAITGDTGAGKSTLLDAICLTLYNKAPRFDNIERVKKLDGSELKRNELQSYDPRNMLRRGCREGSCSITFSVGNKSYSASWNVRLKRTGSYDSVSRRFEQIKPNHKTFDISAIDDAIQKIVGLDYLQFTRTVVLAQNSFANFLKARQADKSALLEKLTGTEIYGRISQAVFELNRQAEQALAGEGKMMEGIRVNLLDEDDLKRLNDSYNLDRSRLTITEELLNTITQKQLWYESYELATIKLHEAEKEQQRCHKTVASNYAEEQLLHRHDEVVTVQPLFQEIKVVESEIQNSKSQMSELTRRIAEQKQKVAKAGDHQELLRSRCNDVETQFKQMQPKLNRGYVLQGEIAEANKESSEKLANLSIANKVLQEKRKAIAQKSEELAQVERKIEQYKTSLHALTPHKQMLERVDVICEKLNRFNHLNTDLKNVHDQINELNKKKNNYQLTIERAKKEESDLSSKLNISKNEIFVHVRSNSGLDGHKLQLRTNELYETQRGLKNALELWKHIAAKYQLLEIKSQEIRQHQVHTEQEQKDIDSLQKTIDKLSEVYEQRNTAYTLSQSQNITSLRQRLKEGSACPVCGATHHPYHTETEQELGKLLQTLEKEFKETDAELKQRQKALSELRHSHATGVGRLKAEEDFHLRTEKELSNDIESWKQYASLDRTFSDASSTVNRNARRLMIEQLLENTDRNVKEAQASLDTYNYHQTYINNLNEKIGLLETELSDKKAKMSDLCIELRVTISSIDGLTKDKSKLEHLNTDIYEELDTMITITSWFASWNKGHDSFCIQIMKMAEEWNSKNSFIKETELSEYRINEELKAMMTLLKENEQRQRQITEDHVKIQELLKEKQQEFTVLFDGQTIEKVNKQLQEEYDSSHSKFNVGKQEYEQLSHLLLNLDGQLHSLTELKQKREETLSAKRSELDIWIAAFNHAHNPIQMTELEELFNPKHNWNSLRKLVTENREQLMRANDKLDEARKKMLALQASETRPQNMAEETKASLIGEKEITIAHLNEIREKLSATHSRLQIHERCTKQLEDLSGKMDKLKEKKENWERLNLLIGSADGKKFREQAQSYTFRFLVDYANTHLERLSTRYRLRNAENSLSLEIVDRDMFDEIRPVNSLSGGETFIVSLGLALGLSSLSSNNLNIASLFIDEGFGNLDNESLELVMSALSNLQSEQGRRVGVISHTEQIRTRIQPQIRLVKYPVGGRSRIEIR